MTELEGVTDEVVVDDNVCDRVATFETVLEGVEVRLMTLVRDPVLVTVLVGVPVGDTLTWVDVAVT